MPSDGEAAKLAYEKCQGPFPVDCARVEVWSQTLNISIVSGSTIPYGAMLRSQRYFVVSPNV